MKIKKVLFVATVTGHINAFHIPYLEWFKKQGYEVHVASNGDEKIEHCDKHFNLQFARNPLKTQNLKVYRKLKNIIEKENYEIIHCHTPVGGVLTRLAAKKTRKTDTKVIYTAHGFHFYKGAPLLNWLIYYPIEKWMSKYTDCLITMNEEDFTLAKNKFEAKRVEYTHGVGVRTDKFSKEIKEEDLIQLKSELNINENDFVIIYVAELIPRKNHYMLLECMKKIVKENKNIKLLLAGNGPLEEKYKEFIKENELCNNIYLLGYRLDIPELMKIVNIAVSVSKQEGLPVNVMEAMLSNLPAIVTNCRGNADLVENGKNGYVINIGDIEKLKEKIKILYNNKILSKQMGLEGNKMIDLYKVENVKKELEKIYESIIEER
jgi:glycosyltransferase EpsD